MGVVSQQYGKDRIFFPIDKQAVVWYTVGKEEICGKYRNDAEC